MTFNVVQSIPGPTHEHGHTLGLVLSQSLPVSNVEAVGSLTLLLLPRSPLLLASCLSPLFSAGSCSESENKYK